MRILLLFFKFFCLISVIFSCQLPDERAIDTREVAQQVKDHKPKRVTENELQKWLNVKSNVWFAKIQRRLLKQITPNISDSLLRKIPLNPELDSLQKIYKFELFFVLPSDIENPTMKASFDKMPKYKDVLSALKTYPQNTEEVPNIVKISSASAMEKAYKTKNYIIHFPLRVAEKMRGIWVIVYEREQAIRFFDYKEILYN